jgi:hypothetical protein
MVGHGVVIREGWRCVVRTVYTAVFVVAAAGLKDKSAGLVSCRHRGAAAKHLVMIAPRWWGGACRWLQTREPEKVPTSVEGSFGAG